MRMTGGLPKKGKTENSRRNMESSTARLLGIGEGRNGNKNKKTELDTCHFHLQIYDQS